MLKTVAFENCVHFKDKTIIYLNSENNKSKVGVNNLNIFVGANFCEKSTVLELIRRCLTEEINVSVTNSFDENLIAYTFCQFGVDEYEEVVSGIIKEPGDEVKVYKFLFSLTNKELFFT